MKTAFLDTSGWFAAFSRKEARHREALAAYQTWIEDGTQLLTTNLVVAEMQVLIARFRGGSEGLRFLDSLHADPTHEVVYVDRDLERAAVDHWLRRFQDQTLSLADAVSFEVMRWHKVETVLALNEDFARAGFTLVPG